MVEETGATRRPQMLVMLQRWGRTRFEFRESQPNPWTSADGCVRLHWSGFLDSGVQTVVAFSGRT